MLSCPSFQQPAPSFASSSLHTVGRAETVPQNPVVPHDSSWQPRAELAAREHYRVCTVLKNPGILGGVLEKSLNVCARP